MEPLLSVSNLVTQFHTEKGIIRVVDDISFQLTAGSSLALVGESGCGKSVTSLSIVNLLPKPHGEVKSGVVKLNGLDLTQLPVSALEKIRGRRIAMIFQEPMTALNPVYPIGRQIREMFLLHFPELDSEAQIRRSVSLLEQVGIPDPIRKLDEYPHQLSGGMRQRVMIAMALAGEPEVLIADEPTTALDVTIQAQILRLLKDLQQERGLGLLLITHDLGIVSEMCDHIAVMYAGKIVESAATDSLFRNPSHPYTKGLLGSIPSFSAKPKSKLQTIEGMVPAPGQIAAGCRFRNRCKFAEEACATWIPESIAIEPDHTVMCRRVLELKL